MDYNSSYGTIFMSAREYLPSLGRFLSADSMLPGAGTAKRSTGLLVSRIL
jgi:hypothetical protein